MRFLFIVSTILILGCKSINPQKDLLSNYPTLKKCDSIGQIAKKDYKNTEGCVAVSKRDLRKVIKIINKRTIVFIN